VSGPSRTPAAVIEHGGRHHGAVPSPPRGARPAGGTIADRVRLPVRVDVAALRADVDALPGAAWLPHFNTGIYTHDWSGVALRAVGGSVSLYPDPGANVTFADTDLLSRCPGVRAALAQFACPLQAVRLLRLGPGASIREHRDHRLSFEDGEVRLHVPITTSPDAEFVLAGTAVPMAAGECWYLDLTRPHRAHNRGAAPRVHLVIDAIVTDWLTGLLRSAPSVPTAWHALVGGIADRPVVGAAPRRQIPVNHRPDTRRNTL
jgi:hypothetical protein